MPPVYEGAIRQGGIEVAGVSAPDKENTLLIVRAAIAKAEGR